MTKNTSYHDAFDEAAKEKRDTIDDATESSSASANEDKKTGEKAQEASKSKAEEKKDDWKALYEAEKARRTTAEKALQQYAEKESGDVSKPDVTSQSGDDMRSLIRTELQTLFGPTLMAQAMRQHLDSIAKEHPDWSEIADSDDLKTWIDSHPDYMAQSLRQVATQGTAQQVVDMLKRFKEHKNGGRNADARQASTGIGDLTRRVLDATAVRGRSAGPPTSSSGAQDFASAFAEAAKALS
ncbi:hypothetical protein [Desulfovibrio inopinatus]|uniref:hypothetical protein n=1 Tax=Desulfovibrio inopinatus TaxID=102109 RepID=UPI0004115BDF|nr:hypothetical protein [Desulfovibrio inopinatus]